MENLIAWLASLPHGALYGSMALVAAVENIFPPIPADTVVAIGAMLAARGQGTALAAFLAVWLGNVAGAMGMYVAGRHFGSGWMDRWMQKARRSEENENRLQNLYERYGLAALALSRFLPGVRALVPPFSGALKIPAPRVLLVVAVPSGLWYGIVTLVGFQLGTRLDQALALIRSIQGWVAVVSAVVILGIAAVAYRWWQRSRQNRQKQ